MARDPKAEVEISAQSRNLGARLREARAKFAAFGGDLKKNIFGKDLIEKGFWSKGGAQLVGNLGSSAFTGVAGFLAGQAKEAYQYQDALKRLQIAGGATSEQMVQMDRAIRHGSDATGISKRETVAAARQYVALTGDLDGASKSIETWARVAQASDSNIADVASTAQALRDNLKIDPSQMQAAFDILTGQGKQGAVEMSELRNQLATVTPLMAQFGGGASLQGLADLGATLQVVRKGFGSTEETITGVQSLMTAMIKNAARLHRAGIEVYDKDPKTGAKHLKSFRAEFDAISNSKLMKDPTKLEKAFGRVEAYRAFLQLKDNRAEFEQLANAGQYAGTTQRDLAAYTSSAGGRIAIAWQKAKNAIADAVTPERINMLATAIEKAAAAVGPLVHQLEGVGHALGAFEGIGESVRGALSDVEGSKVSMRDLALLNSGGLDATLGADNSSQAMAARLAGAKSRIADADAFNKARSSIMDAENDGKTSASSIRAAFSAKYNQTAYGKGHLGAEDAGRRYLVAARVQDPIEVALKEMQKITAAGQAGKASAVENQMLNVLRDILHEQRKGTKVQVDGKNVVDAHKQARTHAGRP